MAFAEQEEPKARPSEVSARRTGWEDGEEVSGKRDGATKEHSALSPRISRRVSISFDFAARRSFVRLPRYVGREKNGEKERKRKRETCLYNTIDINIDNRINIDTLRRGFWCRLYAYSASRLPSDPLVFRRRRRTTSYASGREIDRWRFGPIRLKSVRDKRGTFPVPIVLVVRVYSSFSRALICGVFWKGLEEITNTFQCIFSFLIRFSSTWKKSVKY